MANLDVVIGILFLCLTIRHFFVLKAVLRSQRFLSMGFNDHRETNDAPYEQPVYYIVLPVLREADIIRQTVTHFEALAEGHQAHIVVVTTDRENIEQKQTDKENTVLIAEELAKSGKFIHLHYPDASGIKADQLNFAIDFLLSSLSNDAVSKTFLVCYDADSRPPLDSLSCFEKIITRYPDVDIFHQSSKFELHHRSNSSNRAASWLRQIIVDAGALRANRFVFAYEIPRLLNRSSMTGTLKRKIFSYVYTHVTGHGLCLRLSLLQRLPFPKRSPLEDMHYSFIVGSRNTAMLPIPSLDCAEVPTSLRAQVGQAARWFIGPARFLCYLRDPKTAKGLRAWMLSASALGICLEWLSCSIMPIVVILSLWYGSPFLRVFTTAFVIIYFIQLVATDRFVNSPIRPIDHIGRVFAYPINCTLFGIGGIIGATWLLRNKSGIGKTPRSIHGDSHVEHSN